MEQPQPQAAPPFPVSLLALGFSLVLVLKLALAGLLDLYSDEVFYWQASTNPALAYSDLPFMTSLLAGLGSALDPGSAWAVRLPFILMGSLVPLLVYWLALPLTDRRQALESAALALCLPLGAFLGLLAVPDVPLMVFGLLAVGSFERALRTGQYRFWLATGVCTALGLSTHYRFLLYPGAVLLLLCLYPPLRPQWRNPRLWLAMAIAACGLIPIIWFNLNNALSSASFYLVERHPWEFSAVGLLHLFKQAGLVTPPLYAVLLLSAWLMLAKARAGHQGYALLLSVAALNLLVYLVLAPWTDANSTSIHWPLSGYFPLLVLAPASLRWLYSYCVPRWPERRARRLVLSVPMVGFAGTLIAFIGVGSQAFQGSLQPLLGPGVLSNKMAGWKQFAAHTGQLLQSRFPDTAPVLVTDNYYTAAQAEFAGLTPRAITLDRDKAVRDGRIAQYRLWGQDESGLAAMAGRPALYINEDSTLTVPDKHALLTVMCGHSERLTLIDELVLFHGDKRFSFYQAERLLPPASPPGSGAQPCPYPARAWIDQPLADARLSGDAEISGWAYNEDIGVAAVYLLLDGKRVAGASYGGPRQDVVAAMGVSSDPNAPALGWSLRLDTRELANGAYRLAIEIINQQGNSVRYGDRRVRIANPSRER